MRSKILCCCVIQLIYIDLVDAHMRWIVIQTVSGAGQPLIAVVVINKALLFYYSFVLEHTILCMM